MVSSKLLKLVLVIIVIAIGAGASLALYVRSIFPSLVSTALPTGSISAQFSISNASVYVDDSATRLVYYVLGNYYFANATDANISISAYTTPPAPRIYLVNTQVGLINYCLDCFSGGQLYNDLYKNLKRYGFIINSTSMNYVGIDNLTEIPNDSVVIIPSGLMPVGLLPDSLYEGPHPGNGNFTILDMMKRGDTIVYVGRNFTSELGSGQTIFVTPQNSLSLLREASIIEVPVSHNMTESQNYSAQYNSSELTFNSPTFWLAKGNTPLGPYYDNFGNVSAVNYTNGTLLVFSNYPNVGWKNASQLAGDIATTLNSRFWMDRIAYGNSSIPLDTNALSPNSIGIAPLVTSALALNNTQNASSMVNGSHGLIIIKLYNANASQFYERLVPFAVRYKGAGTLSMPAVFGQEQTLPIRMEASNISHETSFHLELYDENHSLLASVPVGFYNKSFDILYYQAFTLPPGYYVASLKDIASRTYATSLFYMAPVNLTPQTIDFANDNFDFYVTSNNQTLNNVKYIASIGGQYLQNGTVQDGMLNYDLPAHTAISYGNKTFDFNIFGENYTYTAPYQPPGNSIPPMYIEFGIGVFVVVLLNLILKAPISDDYFVDVPNFPASAKIKLKANPGSVVNIFDTVNYYYHWRLMPLTVEEVRSGIGSSVRYENVPISITTQNTLNVLTALVNRGDLVTAGGYYAPRKWIDSSGHDIEYLVIFRKLRDYCVANAILFTELDSDRNVDMTITKKGSQAQVIIYSSINGMRDVALGSQYKIFIVFIDEQARLDFIQRLYTSYGEKAELMKVGIEYQYIVPLDTGDLSRLTF